MLQPRPEPDSRFHESTPAERSILRSLSCFRAAGASGFRRPSSTSASAGLGGPCIGGDAAADPRHADERPEHRGTRGLIDRNPAATVELPRAPSRTRTATWSAEELGRFLDAIRDDRLHLLYLLLGLVGLRRGEAVALRWGDVDLNAGSAADRAVGGPGRRPVGGRATEVGVRAPGWWPSTTRPPAGCTGTSAASGWRSCAPPGARRHPDLVFTTPAGRAAGPGLRVPALRPAGRPARAAPDPAARPAAHLGLHRPGLGGVAAGGEPPPGALLDHGHRRHLLPHLPGGGQGVRRTARPDGLPTPDRSPHRSPQSARFASATGLSSFRRRTACRTRHPSVRGYAAT